MLTKISKWSKIQDSFRITPKIKSLVVFAIPDIPWKFQKDHSITFWVTLLTHRQTNKLWQKHNLLGGGNKQYECDCGIRSQRWLNWRLLIVYRRRESRVNAATVLYLRPIIRSSRWCLYECHSNPSAAAAAALSCTRPKLLPSETRESASQDDRYKLCRRV